MIPESEWKWYGDAAHFICGSQCEFHLATQIGTRIVSTVGKLFPDSKVRAIYAQSRGVVIEGKGDEWDWNYRHKMPNHGYEQIGCDRLYETMVFDLSGKICGCGCGLPKIIPNELDCRGYNDAIEATEGHMELCRKWAKEVPDGNEDGD